MPHLKTSNGTVIKFVTKPLFLGIKRLDKEIAKENLFSLKNILDVSSISFGLIAGTLLGAIRERDFITHDEDIDLFFLEEERQKLFDKLPEILKQGFQVARYDRRGLLTIIRKGEYIDLYFFSKLSEGIRVCSGWCIPEVFLLETCFVNFLGEYFRAPKNYIQYLEYEYGSNWKTPISYTDFKVGKIIVTSFVLKEWLKDQLPDCLYLKLAKKKERKMIASYKFKLDKFFMNVHS